MRIQNNFQTSYAPNFNAIRSVKCEGLYKKHPRLGRELVETFKSNPKAMEFCEKYDVDIVFHSCKRAISAVESSIHILFNNPAKNKFLGILGNSKDTISLTRYDDAYNTEASLKESTDGLKNYITGGVEGKTTGILDAHLKLKHNKIQETILEKSFKDALKNAENKSKNAQDAQKIEDQRLLDKSIAELIRKSK